MDFKKNDTDLKISDFEVFVLVVKERSFLKVADKLGVTNANINRIVKKFERYFGTKLYSIRGGGIFLNSHGERVLESAIKILEIVKSLREQDDKNLEQQLKTEISIISTQSIVKIWTKNILLEIIEKFPQYNFSIHSYSSEHDIDLDSSDIIVWPEMNVENQLHKRLLTDFKFGLFASDEYVRQHGLPKTKEDLKNHTIILLSLFKCSPFAQRSNQLFEQLGVKAAQVYSVNQTQVLYEMIDQGKGIGPLSLSFPGIEKYHHIFPENITHQECYIYYKKTIDKQLIEFIAEKLK